MSALPGGAADKAGNQYEHWWTALRIADVLDGTATRIRLEPPGALGTGAEFTIEQYGVTWAEQVKDASAGGRWTITRLANENVLAAAKQHIDNGRRFRFVASTSSSLQGLCDRANSSETIEELSEQLNADQAGDFHKTAEHWGVEPEQARLLLREVDVAHHTNESLRQLVRSRYQLLFSDDPEVVAATIREYCDDHLHETLTAPAIWSYLKARGFDRRLIVGDSNTIDSLHKTVERQLSRVRAAGPDVGLVPRADVDQLVERLRDPASEQVIVLDGRAGYGKSTVVAEVATQLEQLGWFVAVARMDGVDSATNTSDKLGISIGLKETPVVLLAGVADGEPALLIVDQLDAVSSYSGRIPDNFESVAEALREIEGFKNVKALLVVRTVDLDADSRLRRLVAPSAGFGRHTLSLLPTEAVISVLASANVVIPTHRPTLELLRTPLHLAVFSRLSATGQALGYRTLQDLYDQYTSEARARIAERVGPVDWQAITGSMVNFMSDQEQLVAPAALLDAAEPAQLQALVSEGVLASDGASFSFFHESYFDYLFARSFVGAGLDLHEFLASSGQVLFRRAQTRQVLEHLAATDRPAFRLQAAGLLGSDKIRFHLKAVVAEVLGQYDPEAEDWEALNGIAFGDTPIGPRVRMLLGHATWFDAADALGLWERWLADPDRAGLVFRELLLAARERPQRVVDLVRPHVDESEDWRLRIRSLVEWSLSPGLTDFVIELIEMGHLDDARGRIAVNSDFWSLVYGLNSDSPVDAIRVAGAHLRRSLARAAADGVQDPFEAGTLELHSQSGGVLDDMRRADPRTFVDEFLPFVIAVAMVDQQGPDHLWPFGRRWAFRHIDTDFTIDDDIFNAVDAALRDLAAQGPESVEDALDLLRGAESRELRFLACRTLTVSGPADTAVEWLLEDSRNLVLGWADSPRWAARDLIEAWSGNCSQGHYGALEAAVLAYKSPYEDRYTLGHGTYELLSALDPNRLSTGAKKTLAELTRRFGNRAPTGPSPVEAHVVGPPIGEEASKKMTDENWLQALAKHNRDEPKWDGGTPVGGARELAQLLGRRTSEDPQRFARLAMKVNATIPASAIEGIIWNLGGDAIDADLLADVCEHARGLYGEAVGRCISSAIAKTTHQSERLARLVASCANDSDPERELAHTPAGSGDQNYFGGDLLHAGINSTRGEAAIAAAHILFETDEFTETLRPAVQALANDPILAVRTCAADAVAAMLNRDPAQGILLGEELFDTSIEVLDARTTERLLIHLMRRNPERFSNTLADGLGASDAIATRAGVVWGAAFVNDVLGPGLPSEVLGLPPAARRGAAEVFQSNLADCKDELARLFDDPDDEVRRRAARGMRHLDDLDATDAETLIRAFLESRSFAEHFDDLIDALDHMTATLPDIAIEVCERAVDAAGTDMGDIRTARALTGPRVTTIVLRLYRQSEPTLRSRCLDLVDRLTEIGAHGVTDALAEER
jgi:hypothetical protein